MARLQAMPDRIGGAEPKLRAGPKVAESFYTSAAWRGLLADLKRVRGRWCQRCGSGERIIGDHIVERKDGGADLDPMNVELLCHRCHQRKTADARAKRASAAIR